MGRRTKGDGSLHPMHHEKHGCPPLDADGERPDHKCRAPWRGVVDLGWVGGKRVRRSVSAPTLRELRPKYRDLQKRLEGGVVEEDLTVEAYFTWWLEKIAGRSVRPRTLATYEGYVRTWVVPFLGRYRLSKLRPEHIEAMYDAMHNAGRADATVRQVHAIVKKALTDAVRRGRLLRSPADIASPPPVGKGRHAHLEEVDARKVLGAAHGDTERVARLSVAILLGLRQSEALGLRWPDLVGGFLSVERGVQRIKGQGLIVTDLKTDSSRRTIPVPAGILRELEAWRVESGGEGYVFGGERPTEPRKDYEAWRQSCIRAGVAPVPLHGARASMVTLLIDMGVPVHIVSAIAGHSDVSVTLRHYARSDALQMGKALEGMDRMLEPIVPRRGFDPRARRLKVGCSPD